MYGRIGTTCVFMPSTCYCYCTPQHTACVRVLGCCLGGCKRCRCCRQYTCIHACCHTSTVAQCLLRSRIQPQSCIMAPIAMTTYASPASMEQQHHKHPPLRHGACPHHFTPPAQDEPWVTCSAPLHNWHQQLVLLVAPPLPTQQCRSMGSKLLPFTACWLRRLARAPNLT